MKNGAHKATLYLLQVVGFLSHWKWSVDVEDINGRALTTVASPTFPQWADAFHGLRTVVSQQPSDLTDEEAQVITQWLDSFINAGNTGCCVVLEINQNPDGSSVIKIGHTGVSGIPVMVQPIHVANSGLIGASPSMPIAKRPFPNTPANGAGQDLLDMVPF